MLQVKNKIFSSAKSCGDIFMLNLSEKAPTRLTRKICEFEAAYLSDMYYYITAAL